MFSLTTVNIFTYYISPKFFIQLACRISVISRESCAIVVVISSRDSLPQSVIFLPARPASQTHDSHKGRMILNHVNPAGRIKNCGEKSAFKNLQLSF